MNVCRKVAAGCAVVMFSGFALGCATADSTSGGGAAVAGPKTYACAEGKSIRLEGASGDQQMRLTLPEGRDVMLPLAAGAKGKTYSDGTVTLTFEEKSVSVTFASGRAPLTGCVAPR